MENKLPKGAEEWKEVDILYKVKSSEDILCNYKDLKQYWVEKLCNCLNTPEGLMRLTKSNMILFCQRFQAKILEKSNLLN